jgi:hypothetical protein
VDFGRVSFRATYVLQRELSRVSFLESLLQDSSSYMVRWVLGRVSLPIHVFDFQLGPSVLRCIYFQRESGFPFSWVSFHTYLNTAVFWQRESGFPSDRVFHLTYFKFTGRMSQSVYLTGFPFSYALPGKMYNSFPSQLRTLRFLSEWSWVSIGQGFLIIYCTFPDKTIKGLPGFLSSSMCVCASSGKANLSFHMEWVFSLTSYGRIGGFVSEMSKKGCFLSTFVSVFIL